MINQIREWYQNRIPHINSPQFPRFVGDSFNFVRYILGDHTKFYIRFKDRERSGSADPETGVIVLPTWPLSPTACQAIFPALVPPSLADFSTQAIGFINGLLVHEAWHVKVTPPYHVQWQRAGSPDHEKLFSIANNIVEDVYINSRIAAEPYSMFVQYLSETSARALLPDRVEEYNEALETGENVLGATVAMLCRYTNVWDRENPVWNDFREYTDIIDQVLGVRAGAERAEISRKLYDKLLELAEEQGEDPDEVEGDESAGVDEEVYKALSRESREVSLLVENEFRTKLEREDEFGDIPPAVEIDIQDYSTSEHVRPDPKFAQVGRILKLLRSKNYTPGIPRDTGTKMLNPRLWRAATDRKIFGVLRPVDKSDKDEVILLLDFSGSIGSRFRKVIARAALGCAISMRQSRIRFMIFAHTGRRKAEVYRIATYNMRGTTPDLQTAFARSLEINMSNNYDGFAIEHVGKYFSRGDHNKTLIILSDGQPAGHDYGGGAAKDHTARAADKLRKRGINVLGMSLVAEVIDVNIEIYGKTNHVDATRDVNESLKETLLTRI